MKTRQTYTRLFGGFILVTAGYATAPSQSQDNLLASITIETETGFENIGDNNFRVEEEPFYSNGAAIMIDGYTDVGGIARVTYNIDQVPAGIYDVTVHYVDENDGHSPVTIWIGGESQSFVMNADTESAFASEANMRRTTLESFQVGDNDTMIIEGEVHRYNSEHKELVRLDKIVFQPYH